MTKSPTGPAKAGSPAFRSVPRKLALGVITEVLSNRRPLDDALDTRAADASPADRAWLTETASGVLRNLRRLDLAIDAYALKKKPSGKLRKMLEIAAYQLIHQDRVFPATVVSETVDLVRQEEGEATAKFANALLRRIAEARGEWKSVPRPPKSATAAEKAAWASLPEWWWSKWEREMGYERASAVADSATGRPELWFRFADAARMDPSLFEKGPVEGSARLREGDRSGPITSLGGFAEGAWIVQDLASQILCERFSEILRARKAARLLDRCAAPGGKAVAMAWKGFEVLATDPDARRLGLVEENAKRTGARIEIIADADLARAWERRPEAVWIDAPCSGSGILRRHPDVRWLREEKDLAELGKIQSGLIDEAWSKLPSGGTLLYSVCSLFREEGRDPIERLLKSAGADAEVIAEIALAPDLDPSTDGFYGVAIGKR
jgi:16S rRNA (cytosine967-C5)-methyltransferase